MRFLCGPLFGAILLLLPAIAGTTTMRVASAEELAGRADKIVVGVAEASEGIWVGGRIYTRHRVVVEEIWAGKGNPGEVLEVLTLGGRVGDLGQHVAGAARLPLGESLVLFLKMAPDGTLHPFGMWQGVVQIDASHSPPSLVRRNDGARLVGSSPVPFPDRLDALRKLVGEVRRER